MAFFIATNQQRGLVAVTVRGSVLFYSSAILRQYARTSANSVESTSAVRRGSTFHGLRKRDVDVTETIPAQ